MALLIEKLLRFTAVTEQELTNLQNSESLMESYHDMEDPNSVVSAIQLRQKLLSRNEVSSNTFMMGIYDKLAPLSESYSVLDNYDSIFESDLLSNDDGINRQTMLNIIKQPFLTGSGLLYGMTSIVSESCLQDDANVFLQKFYNTACYEVSHSNYADMPIIEALDMANSYVMERCEGSPEYTKAATYLNTLLTGLAESAIQSVEEDGSIGSPCTFNPNPNGIGSLTPFDMGLRTTARVLRDINDASTDDELTEAMIQFGTLIAIAEQSYDIIYDIDTDSTIMVESGISTAARNASSKVQEKVAKAHKKDKTGGVKEAVKRAITPMEKFIQKQYDTLRDKDRNERRDIIVKGGTVPKVWRWIKRGIAILIGSIVGQFIPVAALITGISFIGFIASDKYLDKRERTKLLQEIEDEIQLVNEKIDDSRGDDNKQNKYELMRIRNNLKRTQDKIRFGLKY